MVKASPSSTLALISKNCPNCGTALSFPEVPPVVFPDDLRELDWDYIKNLSLVPKVLAICLSCGFVAVDCLTPVEATGVYSA
ncbi:MAG TPA: hypothetical protein VEJ36_07375 [Nitrososphaerales archaeon]|nr:hypothetical protein [Nitrososphaerales archaeon]